MNDKKLRVLQPTDWSFQPMDDYIQQGGSAFSVSRFGYEIIRQEFDLEYIVPDYSKLYAKILTKILKLEGSNLLLQIDVIKRSKDFDVVYYSADRHPYLIALARKIGLIKTPILMLCHFSYDDTCVTNPLKKCILRMERKLVFGSIDQLMFNCENLMNLAIEHAGLPKKHQVLSGWGADLHYFAQGDKEKYRSIEPYYFAAGGANRDYHTLIEAFRQLDDTLVLSCPISVINEESPLPSNIIFFNYQEYGMNAYDMLRSYYLGCKAVLIPVKYPNHVANGASVMAEAMACGKAIIASDLPTNFVDIQMEGIGKVVKMWDIREWVNTIRSVNDNELKEMGIRAYELAREKYNYELLAENVIREIYKLGSRR